MHLSTLSQRIQSKDWAMVIANLNLNILTQCRKGLVLWHRMSSKRLALLVSSHLDVRMRPGRGCRSVPDIMIRSCIISLAP